MQPIAVAVGVAGRSAPRAFATMRTRASSCASACTSNATTGALEGPCCSGSTVAETHTVAMGAPIASQTSGLRAPEEAHGGAEPPTLFERAGTYLEALRCCELAPAVSESTHAPGDVDRETHLGKRRGQLRDAYAGELRRPGELEAGRCLPARSRGEERPEVCPTDAWSQGADQADQGAAPPAHLWGGPNWAGTMKSRGCARNAP